MLIANLAPTGLSDLLAWHMADTGHIGLASLHKVLEKVWSGDTLPGTVEPGEEWKCGSPHLTAGGTPKPAGQTPPEQLNLYCKPRASAHMAVGWSSHL